MIVLFVSGNEGIGSDYAIIPSNKFELQDAAKKLRADMSVRKFEQVNYFNLPGRVSEIKYSKWLTL
ncbi:MAG: hypothetical protein COB09_18690 [Thalassobium sp.]|nr:MAG: hypothetical protein COB09_18690 [Thalassobium sp.]